jgi:hypothetical protein
MSLEKYDATIQACLSCAMDCEECMSECLLEKNLDNITRCIELTKSCAEICILTARLLAVQSEFIPQLCNLCNEVCEVCAAECAKNYKDSCAEACQKCADACRVLSLQFL